MSATAMKMMVMAFCTTMNTLLNSILVWRRKVPRTTSMGFTRDWITAGRTPANIPTASTMPTNNNRLMGLNSSAIVMWVSNN